MTSWKKDRRDREKKELAKKMGEIIMEGDNILLIIQKIDMVYGFARFKGTVIAFFNPGSTYSLVLTS